MMINLTDEERRKFVLYLRQEAESDKGIMEQMEKLPGMSGPAMEMMKRKYKQDMVAKLIVAENLDRTETMELK